MTGSPADGLSGSRSAAASIFFWHMSRKPEEERQRSPADTQRQTAVLKPDHDKDTDNLTYIRKHTDNPGGKQIFHRVNIPDKP